MCDVADGVNSNGHDGHDGDVMVITMAVMTAVVMNMVVGMVSIIYLAITICFMLCQNLYTQFLYIFKLVQFSILPIIK